jgi:acyl carrier protein
VRRSAGDIRDTVNETVKRAVIRESRLRLSPGDIADDEPLNGATLRINSLAFVGILVQLEDDLDIMFPDDLFEGHSFRTVADLVDVLVRAYSTDEPEAAR